MDLYSAIYDSPILTIFRTRTRGSCDRLLSARTPTRGWPRSASCSAIGKDGYQKEAARALAARAATLIAPDAKLAKDAPELISAMLAAGYDQAAARWVPCDRAYGR